MIRVSHLLSRVASSRVGEEGVRIGASIGVQTRCVRGWINQAERGGSVSRGALIMIRFLAPPSLTARSAATPEPVRGVNRIHLLVSFAKDQSNSLLAPGG